MRITRSLRLLLLVFCLPLAAFAQSPSSSRQVVDGIYSLATAPADLRTAQNGNKLDFSVTATRGGSNSGRPLGLYTVAGSVKFASEYKDLNPHEQADWAYELGQYIQSNGGGFDNFLRYRSEQANPNPLFESLGTSKKPDPWDRSMIPYEKLSAFAQQYWDQHSATFNKAEPRLRSWWLNDSILDGSNLYMEYQQRLGGHGTTDFIMYKDAVLERLLKRQ